MSVKTRSESTTDAVIDKSVNSQGQGGSGLTSKRVFDIVFAVIGLLFALPLGVLIALVIKLSDGGPLFYAQIRVGQFGRPFSIRKFRSMVVNADKIGVPVTQDGDPRVTAFGRFLRKTKFDELPQLWNVLIGEMSFVGPRPEVPRYVDQYTPEQRSILQYRPGITDMATLLFRNEEALLRGCRDVEQFYVQHCLPRKIELNRQYARRANMAQDLWIILQTLCPYWLGVTAIYGLVLTASLGMTYLLKFDFRLSSLSESGLLRLLLAMIVPQLILLVWGGQVRGLLSYFSLRELKQTAMALGAAMLLQLGLRFLIEGALMPSPGIIVIHALVSFVLLAAVRLLFRHLRERAHRSQPGSTAKVRRVAIVGTGELATNLALDLSRNEVSGWRVVAFFDDNPHVWHKRPHDIPVAGMPECLLNSEWLKELDEVIVALPEKDAQRAREISEFLKGSPLNVSVATLWPMLRPASI